MKKSNQQIDYSPYSILFVDDEEMARLYFDGVCSPEFSVITAKSASEALTILEKDHEKIAVVLTDQRMPKMSGTELLTTIQIRYPGIIRMLTTAYMDVDPSTELVTQGKVLYKPWNVNELKKVMGRAMEMFIEHQ